MLFRQQGPDILSVINENSKLVINVRLSDRFRGKLSFTRAWARVGDFERFDLILCVSGAVLDWELHLNNLFRVVLHCCCSARKCYSRCNAERKSTFANCASTV